MRIKLSLLVGLLALVIPFFNYLRYPPFQDWWTMAICVFIISLSLLIAPLQLYFSKDEHKASSFCLKIPIAVVFFGAWLVYITFSQFFIFEPNYPLHNTVLAFVLLFGILIYALKEKLSIQYVLIVLSSLILIGGLVQAFIGFTQAFGIADRFSGFFIYSPTFPKLNIFGNFAQRNQFAHFLGWALLATCYLYSVKKLKMGLVVPCLLILALNMTWSGSRLVLAYGFVIGCLAFFWSMTGDKSNEQLQRFIKVTMLTVLIIAFFQLFSLHVSHFLQWLGLPIEEFGGGGSRMFGDGFGARRRIEWEKAWLIFKNHPWIGVGLGGYAYEGVALESLGEYSPVIENLLFTHSHNLFTQLLAETGIIGTGIVLVGLIWCILPFFQKKQRNTENLFLVSLIAITFIHSMFEYPLWYLPFLAAFVVYLSLSPVNPLTLTLHKPKIFYSFVLVLSLGGIYYVFSGISLFYDVMRWQTVQTYSAKALNDHYAKLFALSRNPFWFYEADSFLGDEIRLSDKEALVKNRDLLDRLVKYQPYPALLAKLALSYAYSGDLNKSKSLLLMFLASYPVHTEGLYNSIKDLHDPQIKPLVDMLETASNLLKTENEIAVFNWATAEQRKLLAKHPELSK